MVMVKMLMEIALPKMGELLVMMMTLQESGTLPSAMADGKGMLGG